MKGVSSPEPSISPVAIVLSAAASSLASVVGVPALVFRFQN